MHELVEASYHILAPLLLSNAVVALDLWDIFVLYTDFCMAPRHIMPHRFWLMPMWLQEPSVTHLDGNRLHLLFINWDRWTIVYKTPRNRFGLFGRGYQSSHHGIIGFTCLLVSWNWFLQIFLGTRRNRLFAIWPVLIQVIVVITTKVLNWRLLWVGPGTSLTKAGEIKSPLSTHHPKISFLELDQFCI